MTGIELRDARTNAGLTQEQLAELCGIHRQTVINDEKIEDDLRLRKNKMYEAALANASTYINKKRVEELLQLVNEDDVKYTSSNQNPLNNKQMSAAVMSGASASYAVLDMVCEVVSFLKNEPFESVKNRARHTVVVKSKDLQELVASMV